MSTESPRVRDPDQSGAAAPREVLVHRAYQRYTMQILNETRPVVDRLEQEEAKLVRRRDFAYRLQVIALVALLLSAPVGLVLAILGLVPLAGAAGGFSLLSGGCTAAARTLDNQLSATLREVRRDLNRERQTRRKTLEGLAGDGARSAGRALKQLPVARDQNTGRGRAQSKASKGRA